MERAMTPILISIVQWMIFCSDLTSATPIVGTIVRSAQDGEFSSVVAIGYRYFGPDLASKLFCTGTLITRRHVLTAAHCIESEAKERVQVYGGSPHVGLCDRYDIEDWITYNDWSEDNNLLPEFTENDIAIITLNREIPDGAKLEPAMISPEASEKHQGLTTAIVGWGKLNNNSDPTYSQTTSVQILEMEECERRWSELIDWPVMVHGRYLCSSAKQPICQLLPCKKEWATTSCGDSGGPLLYNNKILLAVNIGVCPEHAEPQDRMNLHVGLHYYTHFFNHLTNQGLTYRFIHE